MATETQQQTQQPAAPQQPEKPQGDGSTLGIGQVKPGRIGNMWRGATGSPLGAAAALGVGTGLTAYFATPYVMRASFNTLTRNMTPQERAKAYHDMETNMQRNRSRFGLIMGGLAGAGSLYHTTDPDHPAASMTSWNYLSNLKKDGR